MPVPGLGFKRPNRTISSTRGGRLVMNRITGMSAENVRPSDR